MLLTDRPEFGHQHIDKRIDENAVRNDKPTTEHPQAVHGSRNGNEGIGRVQIASEEEPGDDGTKSSPGKPPLVDEVQVTSSPIGGYKSEHGDEKEKEDEDSECDPVNHR